MYQSRNSRIRVVKFIKVKHSLCALGYKTVHMLEKNVLCNYYIHITIQTFRILIYKN